jgi:8-oxo-dGTP diphosphatase
MNFTFSGRIPGLSALAVEMQAPVDVVCAVICRGGEVLIARRPEGRRLAGLWEFPGGKIEPGEPPDEALRRELWEELGCRVAGLRAGPEVVHAYPWGAVRLLAFACHLEDGGPEPGALEHAALAWVSPGRFDEFEWAPADLPLLPWAKAQVL